MVCSIGSAKMAVMATISASGNFSRSATEKAGRQKLVAQYIQKELLEADDANLLDEEDMHIFGLNPLTDPLHLVCCNFCKKPVKASQFAMHAELCRSLDIAEELLLEHDNGTSSKKPQKKERKKSMTAKRQVTTTGNQVISASDASKTAVSYSQPDEWVGFMSSCLVKAEGALGMITGSLGEMFPLAKRPKLIVAVQPCDDIQAQGGINTMHSQDAYTYVPAPLATKTYYSQRNNRLQAAISRMFHHASIENDREGKENMETSETSALGFHPLTQFDDHIEKSCVHSSPITQTACLPGQASAASLIEAGGQASSNFVNQISMIDAYTAHAAETGAATSRYHPKPYSFASESDGRSSHGSHTHTRTHAISVADRSSLSKAPSFFLH